MTLLQYCGLAILTVAAVLLLRETHRSYTAVLASAFLIVSLLAAMSRTSETVTGLYGKIEDTLLEPYIGVVLKAVGLAFLGQITADLCRSAGEATMAGGVEICTKAEIVLVSLPLVLEILQTAEALL